MISFAFDSSQKMQLADFWKSQARKFCDFCKCWIADNKPSIEFHEGGRKHKENVKKRLKEIQRNSAKQAKQQKKFENDFEKMEKAAMAAYLKDVESNTRDMTADKIIREKGNKSKEERKDKEEESHNRNRVPNAAPEAHPRFNEWSYHQSYGAADVDPLDPFAKQKLARIKAREAKANKEAAKNVEKSNEKGKSEKGKGKGKTSRDEATSSKASIRKVWYEARTQGYSYYWNIETNESVWEPPAEGFMSLAEQAEDAKEQALQEEFLKELDKEDEKKKAEKFEEQRANIEREKLREIRKQFLATKKAESADDSSVEVKEEFEEEKIPYRRDYSVPEKPQPYGSWQVVKTIKTPQIDLQLPQVKAPIVPTISFEELPPQKVFKEKTITHISTGDSDEEGSTVSFKRRKLGNKAVRKRTSDD